MAESLRSALLKWMPGARLVNPSPLDIEPVRWPARARVLVIRPDHLGDVLLAGPALARLRARRPEDEITLLVGAWSHEVAGHLAGADRLATFPFPSFTRSARRRIPGLGYIGLLKLASHIRRGRWDAVFILRDDDYVSAWAAALAGVPLRIGHDEPSVSPFLSHALPRTSCPSHVSAAGVALIDAAIGEAEGALDPAMHPLHFHLDEEDVETADKLLSPLFEDNLTRPIAIHPGAGADVKRWTAPRWAAVAREICRPGEPIVLTGSAAERQLTAAIASMLSDAGQELVGNPDLSEGRDRSHPESIAAEDQPVDRASHPVLDLAGQTDIGTLAAVYARCRLVLGPDSGPLHVAAAVGTPTVHLFGPADPARFGPWGPKERHRVVMSDLPCAPCGRLDWPDPLAHPCVRVVPSMAVIAAAKACDEHGRTL